MCGVQFGAEEKPRTPTRNQRAEHPQNLLIARLHHGGKQKAAATQEERKA